MPVLLSEFLREHSPLFRQLPERNGSRYSASDLLDEARAIDTATKTDDN
jgi:hypothetical protein